MTAGYNTGKAVYFMRLEIGETGENIHKSHQKKAARGAFRDRFSGYVQWLTGDLSGVAPRLKGGQYYLTLQKPSKGTLAPQNVWCHDLVVFCSTD